jgi:hypothetical protein
MIMQFVRIKTGYNAALSPSASPLARPEKRIRVRSNTAFRQKPLFCACGERTPAIAGLCSKCYRARQHSRDYFAGKREAVLARDHFRCATCGAGNRVHVHHRHPGISDPDLLITVCSARLPRLASIHRWIPELLAALWAEQNPAAPVQLQLAFGMEA